MGQTVVQSLLQYRHCHVDDGFCSVWDLVAAAKEGTWAQAGMAPQGQRAMTAAHSSSTAAK